MPFDDDPWTRGRSIEEGGAELWWPDLREMTAVLSATAKEFMQADEALLRLDANERSLTHRFAVHLERHVRTWQVDCEYNRDHHLPKRLTMHVETNISAADTNARTVFPDIIVHRRDTSLNLVVIEAKKKSSQMQSPSDQEKIEAYCEQLGYRYGVSVQFGTGDDADESPITFAISPYP